MRNTKVKGGYTPVEMKRVRNGLLAKGLTNCRCGKQCVSEWNDIG